MSPSGTPFGIEFCRGKPSWPENQTSPFLWIMAHVPHPLETCADLLTFLQAESALETYAGTPWAERLQELTRSNYVLSNTNHDR